MKKILLLIVLALSMSQAYSVPDKIDMAKWYYNEAENVFYQLGIPYCDNPVNEKFEKLAVFVPANYFICSNNDDETYSCQINKKSKIRNYTATKAPIVMPVIGNNTAIDEYISVWEYTNEGFIYIYAGSRQDEIPSGLVDLKAAVRYIKYNKNIIPGDKIFTFGMGAGGAKSILLGVSGDSKLFRPYLKKIGALEKISDTVYGSMAWCPITSLDIANEAYEWNLGLSRENIDEDTKMISDKMAEEFANYINQANFKSDSGVTLKLSQTENGVFQSGSYYKYLEKIVNRSLTNFLVDNLFPIDGKDFIHITSVKEDNEQNKPTENQDRVYSTPYDYIKALNSDKMWILYDKDNHTVQITSFEDFIKFMKPAQKPVGAFDGFERQQEENYLFGSEPLHFDRITEKILENTEYSKDFISDFTKKDFVGNGPDNLIDMYNPLYYIMPQYKGYKTSKSAKYYRIRSGLSQGDTALTTEVNLALALAKLKKDVDFETVWATGHVKAERRGTPDINFIKWVNKCLEK